MASRKYGPKRYSAKSHLTVEHVRLDRGGYTSHGRYFGNSPGTKIYLVYGETSDGREIHEYVRAKSAADARAQVTGGAKFRGQYPYSESRYVRDASRGRKKSRKPAKRKSGGKRRSGGSVKVKAYKVSSYKRKAPKRTSRKGKRK